MSPTTRRGASIRPGGQRGQSLVETTLVLPIFLLVLFGTIVFGLWLFYQQGIETVARETARYAAVHSASSNCPVSGWLAPAPGTVPPGANQAGCEDTVAAGWPAMRAEARKLVFGMNPAGVHVTACWSGYHDASTGGIDAGPYLAGSGLSVDNPWVDCTMNGGTNPLTNREDLPCPATTNAPSSPGALDGDDQASNLAVSDRDLAVAANRVVVYACYTWNPPLAGFLLIPETVIIQAVYSEAMQHQR